MPKKYQIGIQKAVLFVIADNQIKGFDYITKQDIIAGVKKVLPDIKDEQNKIGQALYQLQRKTKYRTPRIKKGKDGWSIADERWFKKVKEGTRGNF